MAVGVATASASVINLSLGGYTHGDQPPVALAQLDDSVVVVVAAGNDGSDEPFWPAAFKHVVAVGALDTTRGASRRADFSNYGHWVDIYAPGTSIHSTYLDGSYQEPDKHLTHLKGWASWSGTPFATPQVAAEIARRIRGRGHCAAGNVSRLVGGDLAPRSWCRPGSISEPDLVVTEREIRR